MGKAVGGLLGFNDAADGQARAAEDANRVQKEIYDQTREDLGQYRDLGGQATKQLSASLDDLTGTFTMDDFQADPGYAFRMAEGQKAIERSAAARGGLNTGATLKALTRYGQDMGSQEYNNAYNRFNMDRDQRYGKLMDVAGMGQNAAAQTGSFGQNYANAYGQNVMGAANAQAAAQMAGGQAFMDLAGQTVGAAGATKGGFGALFSDRRLKKNITRLEKSIFKDVPTYRYEYINPMHGEGEHIGVMAQDLLEVDPNHPAVINTNIGYKVDYSKVEVR